MVFTEHTFNKCIEQLNNLNAILFFQPNFGLSIEFADLIKQNFQHDEIVVLDYQDIEKEFIKVLQEQLCDGFFSSKKIIKVYNFKPNGRSKLKDEIKFLNDKKINDKIILFFAPDLDGKSVFKTFFEKGDFTASIACYEDDEVVAKQYIENFFSSINTNIQNEAVDYIAKMLHGDRQLLKSECEKIKLYCKDKDCISIEDVNNLIINEQGADISLFIDNLLIGDIKKAIKEFELLEKDDIQMILLCRTFISSMNDIIDIKQKVMSGVDIDTVIKSKFLFWKRIPFVKKIVSISNITTLENYVKIAFQTEKLSKIYGNNIAKQYFVRNTILYKISHIKY